MSHEIEQHGEQAAAVFARQDAWHQLGTTLDDVFTAEQAMSVGHLGGWDVRKTPLSTRVGGRFVAVPDKFATVRTSPWDGKPEALGVVGKSYTPIQNEENAEFLNALVDESGAHFETAGSLRGGREVFITMKMPSTISVGGVDKVDVYLAALNSHDGSHAFRTIVTPVRVVCANTQAAALQNNSGMYVVRHTTNAQKNVAQARESLGMTFKYVEAFEAEAERMLAEPMKEVEYIKFLEASFESKRDDEHSELQAGALRLWRESDTLDAIKGTRWAAYQCITEYVDHFVPVRGGSGLDVAKVRAERLLNSTARPALKRRAFDLLSVGA